MTTLDRLAAWDAAFGAVRAHLGGAGLLEVSTPFVVPAVAVEPYIEPVPAGEGYVITSPELAMKRVLCRTGRSIFQIAHVRRAGERSARHREEFHLVEWYRVGGTLDELQRDVEMLVAGVGAAIEGAVGRPSPLPTRWERHPFFDLFERTTGVALGLGGHEGEPPLELLGRLRSAAALDPVSPRDASLDAVGDVELTALAHWTELFSLWSDAHLDPWLEARAADGVGVHVTDFPAALAALARTDGPVAHRFESHAGGLELANGYLELRDPVEQRARFELVNALRKLDGLGALPIDEAFMADLETPGLPPCVGVAMGLDRLVMLATGASSLQALDPLG